MNITVVVFCFNEEGTLAEVIDNTMHVLNKIAREKEIIIVNDGSADQTARVAETCKSKFLNTVRIIHHAQNAGIGMALQSGYRAATLDYVCAIPGDGQFDVSQLLQISAFTDKTFYSFYRTHTGYGLYRRFLTWGNRLFNQHLLGIYLRDVNWVKVYRKSQLEMVTPQLSSSLVESEICSKLYKQGVMPIEIPSVYLDRKAGVPKGGAWKTLRKALADMWLLFWVVYRFKPIR